MVFNRKPDLSHVRVFGSVAYAHITEQFRATCDNKARKCLFLGNSGMSRNYRLYDPQRKVIFESRNVKFSESLPERVTELKVRENITNETSTPESASDDSQSNEFSSPKGESSGSSVQSRDLNKPLSTQTLSIKHIPNANIDQQSGSKSVGLSESDTEHDSIDIKISTPKRKFFKTLKQNVDTKLKLPGYQLPDRNNVNFEK